jgi:hypothetical protein
MGDDPVTQPGADNGALGEAGDELATTAQQVRRAAAALSDSGRVGPGDAARGAAEAIEGAASAARGAASAARGAARGIGRAREQALARPWAVVGTGFAVGAGLGMLVWRSAAARARRPQDLDERYAGALGAIWAAVGESAGARDPRR